jgi:hypothetical protein
MKNKKGERNSLVVHINLAKQKIIIDVNEFYLTREVLLMFFLFFIMPEKSRLVLK